MLVFHTLLGGNIGQFGAPGTAVVITGVVIAAGSATEDASATGSGAEDGRAKDARATVAAGAAENPTAAPIIARIEDAIAATRAHLATWLVDAACLIRLRTTASWHGHSPHTGQPGEFGSRAPGVRRRPRTGSARPR
jgi:hypothetical protein